MTDWIRIHERTKEYNDQARTSDDERSQKLKAIYNQTITTTRRWINNLTIARGVG